MKKIINTERGGIRVYKTRAARARGVKMLMKHGWNYFVGYKDTQGPGLSYGKIDWAPSYVKDVFRFTRMRNGGWRAH